VHLVDLICEIILLYVGELDKLRE